MQTERQRQATEIRAQGEQAARRIRAEADRTATVIVAEANRRSRNGFAATARPSATASSPRPTARIRSSSRFYRSMQAYQAGLKGADTRLVIIAGFRVLPLLQRSPRRFGAAVGSRRRAPRRRQLRRRRSATVRRRPRRSAAPQLPVPAAVGSDWLRPEFRRMAVVACSRRRFSARFEHDCATALVPFAAERVHGRWPPHQEVRPMAGSPTFRDSPRRNRRRVATVLRRRLSPRPALARGPGIGRRSRRAAPRRGGQHLDHARPIDRLARAAAGAEAAGWRRRSRISSTSSSTTERRDAGRRGRAGSSRSAPASSSMPSGIIVTNNHVIEDADEITANFSDGSKLHGEAHRPRREDRSRAAQVKPPKPLDCRQVRRLGRRSASATG